MIYRARIPPLASGGRGHLNLTVKNMPGIWGQSHPGSDFGSIVY